MTHQHDYKIKTSEGFKCSCGELQPNLSGGFKKTKPKEEKILVHQLVTDIIDMLKLPKTEWKKIRFGVIDKIGYHKTKGILNDLLLSDEIENKQKKFWVWVNKEKGKYD